MNLRIKRSMSPNIKARIRQGNVNVEGRGDKLSNNQHSMINSMEDQGKNQ